jgi:PAS domain S-box-containing protein
MSLAAELHRGVGGRSGEAAAPAPGPDLARLLEESRREIGSAILRLLSLGALAYAAAGIALLAAFGAPRTDPRWVACALVMCVGPLGLLALRHGQPRLGMHAVLGLLLATLAHGVFRNGAMNAPAFSASALLVVATIFAYGPRPSSLVAVFLVSWTALSEWAKSRGLVAPPPSVEPAIAQVFEAVNLILIIAIATEPYLLLRRTIAAVAERDAASRESDRRFAALSQGSFESIVFSEAGKVLEANDRFAELLGYESSELIGKAIRVLVASRIQAEDRGPYELRLRHKDGSAVPVEARARPMPYLGRDVRVTALRDLRDQKKAEESLRESEERFAALSQATFEAVVLSERGIILDANDQCLELLGYEHAELVGKRVLDCVAPGSRALVEANIRGHVLAPYEHELLTKGGSIIPVESRARRIPYRGRLVRVTAIRSMAERKRAEEELRRSEEYLLLALEGGRVGIWVFDPRADTIHRHPRLPEFFSGRAPANRQAFLERVHPEDRAETDRALTDCLEGRRPSFERVFRIVRDDGTTRWIESKALVFRDAKGGIERLAGTAVDITDRKRVEDALERERALLNDAEAMARLGSFDWDLKTNEVARSDEHLRLNGYSRDDEPRGAHLLGFHPDELPRARSVAEALLTTETEHEGEWRGLRRDGTEWIAEGRVRAVLDASGRRTHIIGCFLDITERKRAEERLRLSEERYRTLIESAPEALFVLEEGTTRIADANEEGRRLFGVRPGPDGPTLLELSAPVQPNGASAPELLEARMHEALGGSVASFDWTGRTPAGEIACEVRLTRLPAPGKDVVRASIVDVTARKRAERAIQEAIEGSGRAMGHEFFTGAVAELAKVLRVRWVLLGELLPDGKAMRSLAFWGGDGLGEPFTYALAKTPCENVVGKTMCAYPSGVRELFPDDAQLRDLGVESYLGAPIFLASGKPAGILCAFHDAPHRFDDSARSIFAIYATRAGSELERMAADEEIRRLNADLERAVTERTAELSASNDNLEAFSYSVSHDLRAPLRAINGFSRALAEDFGAALGPGGSDYLERINAASVRMNEIIESLLALSRLTRGPLARSTVDITSLARSVGAELALEEPDRNVELVVEAGMRAEADPGLLRIVLTNLIGNAWKFTAKASRPCIELGLVAAAASPEPIFFVRDNGVGFDVKHATKLFEPFRRFHASRDFPGTGVGLATVQRAIQRHGGNLWAESDPGRGATFYFSLGSMSLARSAAA